MSTAQKSSYRDFVNSEISNSARVRFVRNVDEKRMYPRFNSHLYDNFAECRGGQQNFTKELVDESYFNIPTGELVSFSIGIGRTMSFIRLTCSGIVTFNPEAGHEYSIRIDVVRSNDQKTLDHCTINVVDDKSGENVRIIPRTKPFAFTGLAPNCDPKEVDNPKWLNEDTKQFQCIIQKTGGSESC
ncbi:hypothetical protein ACFOEK_19990 [Litoribrevibacter euphylliae]|uniref:Cadherin domain-containing protein n=1 Tax=Litoribrevibacter euphylliae TaxID=1834034 RepID=A0ABV7HHH4_9GAMM